MNQKPTYGELEKRVQAQERELVETKKEGRALRENERFLEGIFEGIQDGLSILDAEFNILRINRWMEGMYADDMPLVGKKCYEAYQKRKSPCPWCPSIKTVKTGKSQREIIPYPSEKQQTGWIDLSSYPLKDDHGRVVMVIEHVKDITDKMLAEKELKENEEKYRNLFENCPVGIGIADEKGHLIAFNEAMLQPGGYTPEDIVKIKDIAKLYYDPIQREKIISKARQKGFLDEIEVQLKRKDGTPYDALLSLRSLMLRGRPCFQSMVQDITDRKRNVEALRESEARFRELTELLPETIYEIDEKGNITFVNQKLFDHFRYTQEDFDCGLNAFDMLIPEDRNRAMEDVQKIMSGENVGLTDYTALRKDGSTFPSMIHSIPILREGKTVGLRGFIIDITEHMRAEHQIEKSEESYRSVFENTGTATVIIEEDTTISMANTEFEKLSGFSKEAVEGKMKWTEFVPGEDLERMKAYHFKRRQVVGEAPTEYESRFIDRQGNIKDILYKVGMLPGNKKSVASLLDITLRKKAYDEKLRLAKAIEQADETIMITDKQGNIQYVNPAFERITGYRKEEALGQNPRILKSGEHSKIFYENMWKTLTSRKVWSGTLINRKKDGSFYEEKATISPVLDNSGGLLNYVAVKRDVTNELRMEKQFRQAQKMEAIGTLAGGIAHDFNNILGSIIGYTELAYLDLPEGVKTKYNLKAVLKACDRAKDLVNQILAFSRQSEENKRPIQIVPIAKEALKLLRATLPANIEIRQEVNEGMGIVEADSTQIHQVLMNLCTNAAHAMQEKSGVLEVSLKNTHVDENFLHKHKDLIPGPYLLLTVSDTGHGMTPKVIERIFDPYFTTKDKGVGTGMGLAVVHGIVRGYGGSIEVQSDIGKGSTFHVYLPMVETQVTEEPEILEPLPVGNENILFIDDESGLVDIAKQMLEYLGYDVTTRTSSIEALELFRTKPDRFDLVITDMTMPQMTGDKLAMELIKLRPNIPVILCTGYSGYVSEEKAKNIGFRAFAMKPLVLSDLAKKVRKVLDER